MFTGIVEDLRPVVSLRRGGASGALTLDLAALAEGTRSGDSIAVNGICLTVAALQGSTATFDVSTETLARTAFADLRPGHRVNVERALRVGDRIGGHFVSGHIDGVGRVTTSRRDPGQWTFEFDVGPLLAGMLIEKGSAAVDGVSLTVVEVAAGSFSVAVIPHTFEHTTLNFRSEGDLVNVEADMLGKWVKKLLGQTDAGETSSTPVEGSTLTLRKLHEEGFA